MLARIIGRRTSRTLSRRFTVLAVETSADDTCAAIVRSDRTILSNVVVKQHVEHAPYGGIYPKVAIACHQDNLPGAVRKALDEAEMEVADVDGLAFTRGPGMGGCLSVGANAFRTLAAVTRKPIIGVHHMQAHALTVFLTSPLEQAPKYPFLSLLVSGGHTLLLLVTALDEYKILATTLDVSIGNAIDRAARLLQVPYDSSKGLGASLEALASTKVENEPEDFDLQMGLPLRSQLAFSFSGLYSRVQEHLARRAKPSATAEAIMSVGERAAFARAIQNWAFGHLEDKVSLGLRQCRYQDIHIRDVVVSGGVASNQYLRERLHVCTKAIDNEIKMHYPPISLCTDNAAMIAWVATYRFLNGDHDPYNVDLRPVWSLEDLKS